MQSNKNIHGLERKIDPETKRIVRQRCGFGCVKCGAIFIQYHHMPPYYVEAKKHDPERITLLCPSCHSMVPKRLSDKVVEKLNLDPQSKKLGAKNNFFLENKNFFVCVGNFVFLAEKGSMFEIEGEEVLSIDTDSGKRVISMKIHDEVGNYFQIIQNEVVADPNFWDIESKGNKIIVRKVKGNIFLEMKLDSEGEMLQVSRLKTSYQKYKIDINVDKKIMITYDKNPLIIADFGIIAVGQKLSFSSGGFSIVGGSMPLLTSGIPLNTDPKYLVRQLKKVFQPAVSQPLL